MSADIPLYLWESFIAVIEEKTLQRAADKLHTTQPTITRHLHQLEESLPLKLFELRGRAKAPTPFAHELYQKINLRLKYLPDDIRESLRSFTKGQHASLVIGGPLEILKKFFSEKSFKGILKLTESPPEDLKVRLKEARIDVLVGYEQVESQIYASKKIFQDHPMLVVPKKFNRSGKDLTDWKIRATQFPLSIYSESTPVFQEYKGKSPIDFEMKDWSALEARAQAGLSWCVIPASYLRHNPSYLSKPYITKNQKSQTDIYLYYRKDLTRNPWFKEFLNSVML